MREERNACIIVAPSRIERILYSASSGGGARILRGIVEGQMEKNNDSRGGKCRFTDRWPPLPALLVSSENNDSSGGVFLVSFLPFFSFLFFV